MNQFKPHPTRLEVILEMIVAFGPFTLLIVAICSIGLLALYARQQGQRLSRLEQRTAIVEQYAAWVYQPAKTNWIRMQKSWVDKNGESRTIWQEREIESGKSGSDHWEDEHARELERRILEAGKP